VLLAIQVSLWAISGRPHSAESMILGLVGQALRRLSPGLRSKTLPD
jgi:hypothetical protein